ncbi:MULTISPECIES: hypothetical protein [Haloferacaceae]|uniref:Uncharacterized protein n=2 Tax=Haloferacaceae TaxID=1644056 RepID=A0ABD6DB58_9EURY|nr:MULTISPECIES: hypothetical protein [Halorubraceae]
MTMTTYPYSDNENRKFTYEETEQSVTITHEPEAVSVNFKHVSNPTRNTKLSIIVNRGGLEQFPTDLFDETPFEPAIAEVGNRTSFITTEFVELDAYTVLLPVLKALAEYAWVDNMNSLHIHNSDTPAANHLVCVLGEI